MTKAGRVHDTTSAHPRPSERLTGIDADMPRARGPLLDAAGDAQPEAALKSSSGRPRAVAAPTDDATDHVAALKYPGYPIYLVKVGVGAPRRRSEPAMRRHPQFGLVGAAT